MNYEYRLAYVTPVPANYIRYYGIVAISSFHDERGDFIMAYPPNNIMTSWLIDTHRSPKEVDAIREILPEAKYGWFTNLKAWHIEYIDTKIFFGGE